MAESHSDLSKRFSWRRVCPGMYELRGTEWAIEVRHHDRLWHIFYGDDNHGIQERTLRDAKAYVEAREMAHVA